MSLRDMLYLRMFLDIVLMYSILKNINFEAKRVAELPW